MNDKHFEIKFSSKQGEAFNLLESNECDELVFGGAKGGGKTVFACKWLYFKVKSLIQQFNLRPSPNPPTLAFFGRKIGVDFTTTTLNTWKRDIPNDAYQIKEQKKLIVIDDAASILYGGLDDTKTVRKFNSGEFAAVLVDQAEECSEEDIGLLRGTLRYKYNEITPKYKALWTCNPPIGDDPNFFWIKRDFIERPKPGYKFLQSLYTDNPYLPPDYGLTLEKAFGFNPVLLQAYKFGRWDDLTSANVVIPSLIVKENVNNNRKDNDNFKRYVTVCDVAGGDDEGSDLAINDETVIYDLENTAIKDEEIYSHRDLMDTVGRIVAHQQKNNSTVVCIDKVGLGAGIYSRLLEVYEDKIRNKDIYIYGFDSRITAPSGLEESTFANYKAYAWFNASNNYFKEYKCYLPDDPILVSQLSSVTFYYKSNGKLAITSKDKLRKVLRSSPDRADAYIMGLDALQYARTKLDKVETHEYWKKGSYVPVKPF